ncbi:putative transcriptional regulator [Geoglobus ahangari]|uniref:Putative transcriptional regulator n=1 Tax=Geoglobus ahangari TaxID=113653 RepID=A0A0F7IEB6_9EURY|nr:PadR family transcriptional regulator [Geoglobus ahangari]AKG91864.1 putative transcriptional regulator [Geoglobus ahangari]NOY10531.1 PadR family transcriptional regulator [Archaeoglobi archaeon]
MFDKKSKALKKLRKAIRSGIYSYLILSMLRDGEMHGYFIRKRLEEMGFAPSEGAMYDMLKSLEKLGLVEGFWVMDNRPRKCYRLTDLGREVLTELESDVRSILRVLGGGEGGD